MSTSSRMQFLLCGLLLTAAALPTSSPGGQLNRSNGDPPATTVGSVETAQNATISETTTTEPNGEPGTSPDDQKDKPRDDVSPSAAAALVSQFEKAMTALNHLSRSVLGPAGHGLTQMALHDEQNETTLSKKRDENRYSANETAPAVAEENTSLMFMTKRVQMAIWRMSQSPHAIFGFIVVLILALSFPTLFLPMYLALSQKQQPSDNRPVLYNYRPVFLNRPRLEEAATDDFTSQYACTTSESTACHTSGEDYSSSSTGIHKPSAPQFDSVRYAYGKEAGADRKARNKK